MLSNEYSGKGNLPRKSETDGAATSLFQTVYLLSLIVLIITLVPSVWSGYACMENPCMHGICIDTLQVNSSHQCYCRNGYTGYSCQINWDECRSNPCLNGGSCMDGIASFNCSCPENFAGVLCEVDLSICDAAFPCQNNGTCNLDINNVTGTGFICSCPPGFTGYQCEIDISVCNATDNVCQNGGKCVDGIGNRFSCVCEGGWSGETCHIDINECDSQPCLNGGDCVNKINDFSCACPFGYTGKACETKLRICEQNTCQNGAFCLNEQDDESQKTCYCVPDFHGTLCEFRYNDCEPAPKCFNGGTCIDGVGEFTCSCPPDFFGPTCQCTAENMTEPECSIPGNGTVSPSVSTSWPHYPDTAHLPSSILFPATQMIPPEFSSITPESPINLGSPVQPGMYSSADIIVTTMKDIMVTASPEIPSPSTFDPGGPGEGRDGLDSTPVYSPESSPPPFLESTTIILGVTPVPSLIPSEGDGKESTFVIYEPSSTIRLDGSEEISSFIQTASGPSITPTPFPQPSSVFPEETISSHFVEEGVDTTIEIQPTPSISGEGQIVSTSIPVFHPPGMHTADLTADFDQSEILSPSLTPTTGIPHQPPEETARDIVPPEASIDPSLPLMTPAEIPPTRFLSPSLPQPSESVVIDSIEIIRSSYIPPDIVEPSQPPEDVSIPVSTPVMTEVLIPKTTSLLLSSKPPPFDGDYDTVTTALVSATPMPSLPPPPTTSPPGVNVTDPCTDHCHNNAKCVAYSIEPICLCSFKYTGNRCEIPRERFRAASFTGDSFLSFRVPNESFIGKVDIRSKLVTIVPDGILLYTGEGKMYALIYTKGGHVTLQFSCGSQSMRFVETRTRVDNGFNFTLDFKMEMIIQESSQRCFAEVNVNQSYVMKGEQVIGKDGLAATLAQRPIETVFIGGVPPRSQPDAIFTDDIFGILPGFRGCLHSLSINQDKKDIYEDALDGKDVAECASFGCVINPCHGTAPCVTKHAYPFWECLCPQGYQGNRCQFIVCSKDPCQHGATCTYSQEVLHSHVNTINDDPGSEEMEHNPFSATEQDTSTPAPLPQAQLKPLCLCPLGYSGKLCEHKLNVTKPAFAPVSGYSSYIAYDPIPRFIDWFQLKFHFVTKNISQISLLLYSGNDRGAQPLHIPGNMESATPKLTHNTTTNYQMITAGFDQTMADAHPEPMSDFFAITILQGFIALTWNLGSGTQRITTPSRIDNRLNIHTLFAGRNGRQAWLKVDGMRNVTGSTPGPLYRLNAESNKLYIGGYKSFRFEGLSHDLPLHQGFQGCIFDLGFRVKNRLYLPTATGGRNVKNCFEEDC